MSADEHLAPQQFGGKLFHGTQEEFKPGDMITSNKSRGTTSGRSVQLGGNADSHMKTSEHSAYTAPIDANTFATGSRDHAEHFAGFSGHIYEVEPTGRTTPDRHDNANFSMQAKAVRSPHPMRVVREELGSEMMHTKKQAKAANAGRTKTTWDDAGNKVTEQL